MITHLYRYASPGYGPGTIGATVETQRTVDWRLKHDPEYFAMQAYAQGVFECAIRQAERFNSAHPEFDAVWNKRYPGTVGE